MVGRLLSPLPAARGEGTSGDRARAASDAADSLACGSDFVRGERHETSPPSLSPAGRGHVRSAGLLRDRQGTRLSGAANTARGSVSSGRSLRHDWPPVGGADEIPTGHNRHREYRWRRRLRRRGAGLARAARWLHAAAWWRDHAYYG